MYVHAYICMCMYVYKQVTDTGVKSIWLVTPILSVGRSVPYIKVIHRLAPLIKVNTPKKTLHSYNMGTT